MLGDIRKTRTEARTGEGNFPSYYYSTVAEDRIHDDGTLELYHISRPVIPDLILRVALLYFSGLILVDFSKWNLGSSMQYRDTRDTVFIRFFQLRTRGSC